MDHMQATSEVQGLRRTIRDLDHIATLCAGREEEDTRDLAVCLATALLPMLDAVFVYVAPEGASSRPVVRLSPPYVCRGADQKQALIRQIQPFLPALSRGEVAQMQSPFGSEVWQVAGERAALGGGILLLAGATASNFPTEAQRLLLKLTAREGAISALRHHAESEERRFRSLVERSSDFIGIADLLGRPVYLNPAGLALLGIGQFEEAAQLTLTDLIAPRDQARAREEIWPSVMRRERWVGELCLRHMRTGEDLPFFVDWFRIDDPRDGQPMNIATVSRDLRAQKHVEAKLRGWNRELERRVDSRTNDLTLVNQQLIASIAQRAAADARLQELRLELFHAARFSAAGEIGAALAHELNQPLTAAANSVMAGRRLLEQVRHPSQVQLRQLMHDTAAQVLRAGQIIRRLRSFLADGEAAMGIEPIAKLIDEACTLALTGSVAEGVTVRFEFDPAARRVVADRVQIQQVIVNLVRNALEAMAGCQRRELLVATVLRDPQCIEISVADTGPGVAKQVAEHLFEPFVSTKRKGMGLGLSICRTIIEAHGGRLWMEPNPDGGAVFRFTLEAAPEESPGDAA